MFEALGLGSHTEAVYIALLKMPDASLTELATHVGIDEAAMRQALDDLARLSLLQNTSGVDAPKAIDPKVGFGMLFARQQADVARRQQEIEESKAAFAIFLAQHAESRARETNLGLDYLDGIDQIRYRMENLAAECQWEACSFMPGGAQSEESLKASRALDAEAMERGVRLRTIYLDSVRNDPATLEYASWLSDAGSEVRTAPTLPLRMLIVDRHTAVVPVKSPPNEAKAMVVTSDGIVTALMALFTTVWKGATPLASTPRRRDSDGLSNQEKQVLRLLAGGLTDEMIARRMGVSVRTARRVASDLLARLDARSRFQAGGKAMARNWIDEDDLG